MNVLECFGEPIYYGGQETFVMEFLRHMDRSGINVDLFTPYYCDNKVFQSEIEEWGGNIISGGLDFAPGKSRANIVDVLKNQLNAKKYDVVHVHSGSISVLAFTAQAAKECGVKKVIVHSHCAVENRNLKNTLLRHYGNSIMKNNVDVYCACSKVAGEAKFVDKVNNSKLEIINNGVDLDRFRFNPEIRAKIRSQLKISDSTFVIGHVGRFSYQKNHEFLLEIFKDYNKINPDTVLLLLGEGELQQDIRDKSKEYGLSEKVIMTNNVNNVNEYLQAFDIFLLPSRFEGLPIVGVEAQAAGLASIVSTNVSSELEMIKEFKYLPIDQGTGIWLDQIEKFKDLPRLDQSECIRSHGYDICATAAKIRQMYLGD